MNCIHSRFCTRSFSLFDQSLSFSTAQTIAASHLTEPSWPLLLTVCQRNVTNSHKGTITDCAIGFLVYLPQMLVVVLATDGADLWMLLISELSSSSLSLSPLSLSLLSILPIVRSASAGRSVPLAGFLQKLRRGWHRRDLQLHSQVCRLQLQRKLFLSS